MHIKTDCSGKHVVQVAAHWMKCCSGAILLAIELRKYDLNGYGLDVWETNGYVLAAACGLSVSTIPGKMAL